MKLQNPLLTKIGILSATNIPLLHTIVLTIYYYKLKHCLHLSFVRRPELSNFNLNRDGYLYVIITIACIISILNIISLNSNIFYKKHHLIIIILTIILYIAYIVLYNLMLNDIDKFTNVASFCNSEFTTTKKYLDIHRWIFILYIILYIFIYFKNK